MQPINFTKYNVTDIMPQGREIMNYISVDNCMAYSQGLKQELYATYVFIIILAIALFMFMRKLRQHTRTA